MLEIYAAHITSMKSQFFLLSLAHKPLSSRLYSRERVRAKFLVTIFLLLKLNRSS